MGFLALLLWEYTQYPLPFGKRRSMRRKLVILFVAVFTSIFGGAACGGEADVQQAEQEVKEAEQNVEEAEQEVKVKEAEQAEKEAELKVQEEKQEEKQEKQETQQGQGPEAD
jgi:uncharacterized protein with von Willebrand factor type A (vWA) domain